MWKLLKGLALAAMVAVAVPVAVDVVTMSAQAQILSDDSGNNGLGSGVIWTLVGLVGAAILNFAGTGWSLFVSYSAKSEAKWDDWVVGRVRSLARDVVKEETSGKSPIPPTPSG